MSLRNGKDRAFWPETPRSRNPDISNQHIASGHNSMTDTAGIGNLATDLDSANAVTYTPVDIRSETTAHDVLVNIANPNDFGGVDVLSALQTISQQPSKSPTFPTQDRSQVVDLCTDGHLSLLRRSTRPIQQTPKASKKDRADPIMPPMSRRPKSTKTDNLSAINAIVRRQKAPARAKYLADVVSSIISDPIMAPMAPLAPAVPLVEEAIATVQHIPPPPTPPVFDCVMYLGVYHGTSKEPAENKRCADVFEFRYEDWSLLAIISLGSQLNGTAWELIADPGLATLTSSQHAFKSTAFTVEDNSGFQDVIETLKDWKESGCRTARIDLKLRVHKRLKHLTSRNPLDATLKSDSDAEVEYVSTRRREALEQIAHSSQDTNRSARKRTVTENRLALEESYRQRDAAAKHHSVKIIEQNQCKTNHCAQSGLPCVVIKAQHIRITTHQIGAWSEAINKHQATLDRPHAVLMANLTAQADANIAKLERKQKKKKSRRNSSSSSGSSPRRGRKRSRHEANRGSTLDALITLMVTNALSSHSIGTHPPHSQRTHDLASSPIRTPKRTPPPLSDYMLYLANKEPARATQWEEAQDLLDGACITFEQLAKIPERELRDIGIPLGVAYALKSSLKKYISKRDKAHSDRSGNDDQDARNS